MATPLDPDYRAHLQRLSDMFAASIPARMAAIGDALAAAGTKPDRQQLEQLHGALHTVAGSAGSFGFTVLGDQARRLEQAVRGLIDDVSAGEAAGESDWAALVPQVVAYLDWARIGPRRTTYLTHD
ncbi:MAG TPA: Hpt domain-containing protein [Pseudoduganella sp.]|jgi:HPt (histidine-containing phosphotransfer) domain-containing protein